MESIDILLIVALAVLLVGIVANLIVRKKQGKTGCGCGCQGCPSASACAAAKNAQKIDENAEEFSEGGTHV